MKKNNLLADLYYELFKRMCDHVIVHCRVEQKIRGILASATVPMLWYTGTPLLDWSCVHPVVHGPFDLRNQKAADAGHMARKPWAAWLPIIVPKHLPHASSYTEKSSWSHICSRIYWSPEKPLALTIFLLKTSYTVKKADYVCNIPKHEVLSPLSKVCHFGIKGQQFCMTTKQV